MSDDEMPLFALAKPTKPAKNDKVPLANLAVPGGGKRGRPSVGGAAKNLPGAPPKPKPLGNTEGRGRPKKDKSSSSSDSSSSSSDSSSDSGDGKKKAPKKRVKLVQKEKNEDAEDNKVSKKSRGAKEQVAVELLCRWWYALPDWPPNDPEGKAKKLADHNLRQVSIQEWEWVPELDDKGRRKVYELTQFRGVFRSSDGSKFDLRPMDSCPSLNNMMKKDLGELYSLSVKAYENQLKDLDNSKYDESDLRNKLNVALTKVREKAHKAQQMTFATGLQKPKP